MMKLGLAPVRMFVAVVLMLVALMCVDCGPGGIEPANVITPATRVTCILLRAFTDSGSLEEVCATADELAPLIEEILAEREATPPHEQKASAATVAFSLAAPPKRVPRRRCVQWQYLGGGDSGLGDASSDRDDGASRREGSERSDGGHDGGERIDGGRQRGDGGGSPSKP